MEQVQTKILKINLSDLDENGNCDTVEAQIYPRISTPRKSHSWILRPMQKEQENSVCYYEWQVLLIRTVSFRCKAEADKKHIN